MDKKIIKNSSYLILGQAVIKVISFFYVIFLARSLGVENFGLFTVALSYFGLVSTISDLGISRFLIREISRDNTSTSILVSNVLILRLASLIVLILGLSSFLWFFDPEPQRVILSSIALTAVIFNGLAVVLDNVFIALEKTSFSAIGLIFLSLVTTLFGVFAINSGLGPMGAIIALVFGQAAYFLFLLYLSKKQKIKFFPQINIELLKKIIRGSLPYGILVVLGFLYFRIDTILLSYLKGDYETGIYGAAYKFLDAVVFIPSSVAAALFPVLVRLHDSEREEIRRIYYQSLKILAIVSLPIMVGFWFILPPLISLVLPQYSQSITAIKILSLTIPFMFVHIPGAMILLSTDKYLKPIILLSIFTLAFNLIANLLLIPQYGYIAASIITVLSEALSFIVFFILLRVKILK